MKTPRLLIIGFTLPCLLLILFSCGKKDSVVPTQALLNTDVESGNSVPDYWFANPGTSGTYTTGWTDEESSSKNHSLKISATTAQSPDFAYWVQTYSQTTLGTKLPVGKDLTLSVKIKAKDLAGQGLSIAVRADNTINPDKNGSQFVTTQGGISINGTFDWKSYTVKLNSLRTDALYVYVFLVYLPNTTGSAYFDDVTLTY